MFNNKWYWTLDLIKLHSVSDMKIWFDYLDFYWFREIFILIDLDLRINSLINFENQMIFLRLRTVNGKNCISIKNILVSNRPWLIIWITRTLPNQLLCLKHFLLDFWLFVIGWLVHLLMILIYKKPTTRI